VKGLWWILLLLVAGAVWRFYSESNGQTVVIHVRHDQIFSEPILRDFEKDAAGCMPAWAPIVEVWAQYRRALQNAQRSR